MIDYLRLCKEIRCLAIKAGQVVLDIYKSDDLQIKIKSDQTPVTYADQMADKLIYGGLNQAFPEIPIVTEEQSHTHDISQKTFLIVDPLDGTKEFIHRRGDFTVNIALVEKGRPVLGVVYAPAKQRLFMTDASGGAYEEKGPFDIEKPGIQNKLHVRIPDLDNLIFVASKSHRDQATENYINKYSVKEMRSAGSSLKFCLVAAGEADIYPRLGRTMEWDTAAGQAVLQGAGGKVVRFDTHTPLTYGKPSYENPFFIAYAPGIDLKSS